ncbi:spermidine synthase [Deinococcus sp.]|uniref:spermidine synthase n=1 Tax=Deinococcus sp. TaxID=47478 RepID=UPI003C7DF71B
MIPWEELGRARIPGQAGPDTSTATGRARNAQLPAELVLARRGNEYSIRIAGHQSELMNSRLHGSEDALAEYACELIVNRKRPAVLIGGLGMGFTMAAALKALGPDASVLVAELVPEVLEWNRGPMSMCAGYPLTDERAKVVIADVAEVLKVSDAAFDAILLDVDNGPEGMTQAENDWLYSDAGLRAAQRALRPHGVLAVWSAGADDRFTARLKKAGFATETRMARARTGLRAGKGKGAQHIIWLARI